MLLEQDEAIQVIDETGTAIGVVNRHNVASMLQAEQR
jgi:predicted transcriptional regulator